MEIVLIRHGQSQANLEKAFGKRDTPLTQKGLEDARALADKMERFKDYRIYTSPYLRAYQTMEALGLEGEILEDIHEIDLGLLGGLSFDYVNKTQPEVFQDWDKDPLDYQFPQGESVRQASQRVARVLDRLIETGEDALLVCHDGVIRYALSYVLGHMDLYKKFKLDNLSLTSIGIIDGHKIINYINRQA